MPQSPPPVASHVVTVFCFYTNDEQVGRFRLQCVGCLAFKSASRSLRSALRFSPPPSICFNSHCTSAPRPHPLHWPFITSRYCNLPSCFFSHTGFTALPHPHRTDHSACPRNHCDIVRPCGATDNSPKLPHTDLPPRGLGQQAPSPQLCRLEQHQKQLLELQRSCNLEEAEQEGKEKVEACQKVKGTKEEVQEMTQEEEMKQRRDLEMQLQQQQEELKQRQQIMQWQQELQQANQGQAVLLSPSSGLCTIYEALESSDEEEGDGGSSNKEPRQKTANAEIPDRSESETSVGYKREEMSPFSPTPPPPDSPETPNYSTQDGDSPPSGPPESPEQPSPLDLDWGTKVDIVQQLINQTLLLNREGCSSLLLLPGGAGGTLSPLESSLWPSLLPPLTPPSATVTSVSSFSPETTGSSPQEEWTVVELETHH